MMVIMKKLGKPGFFLLPGKKIHINNESYLMKKGVKMNMG